MSEEFIPVSEEVFTWPEFEALMDRLGFDLRVKRTTKVVLTLELHKLVLIEHTYLGENHEAKDSSSETSEATQRDGEGT
jgi:hypothetical protein